MAEYKPNSHRYKDSSKEPAADKKVEKIVKGKVKTKKKNEMHKLKDIFISEDVSNVKSYIFMDVLVPSVKKAVSDIVRDGIDMILYGDTHRRSSSGPSSYVRYSNNYSSDRRDDRSHNSRPKSVYNTDDIILESRGEAEEVLTRMGELIDTYGIVSVADLCDLVGISCNYTDNKYGWTNIRNAEPIHVRDGWMLKLPKALPID